MGAASVLEYEGGVLEYAGCVLEYAGCVLEYAGCGEAETQSVGAGVGVGGLIGVIDA